MYPRIILLFLGLATGSFLSAFTYRLPKRIQFLRGRSFCDRCKNKIDWYDNIPLFSYIFLKGKCRHCKKKISVRYPAIELITAVVFVLIGPNIFNLTLFLILFAIFIIDLEHQIIPDELTFIGLGLSIYNLQLDCITSCAIYNSLFSGFLCASILLLIHLLTRGRGMGLGDVKFAVLGGSLVGLKLALPWLYLAFLTGGIIAIILILGGNKKLKDRIAFGPFLIAAIPLSLWLSSSSLSRLLPF